MQYNLLLLLLLLLVAVWVQQGPIVQLRSTRTSQTSLRADHASDSFLLFTCVPPGVPPCCLLLCSQQASKRSRPCMQCSQACRLIPCRLSPPRAPPGGIAQHSLHPWAGSDWASESNLTNFFFVLCRKKGLTVCYLRERRVSLLQVLGVGLSGRLSAHYCRIGFGTPSFGC